METDKRLHRRLRNYLIFPRIQLELLVPAIVLSLAITVALDVSYYFLFAKVIMPLGLPFQPELTYMASGFLVHLLVVSVVVMLINMAAVSAAMIVQTHQILGPLIPITRHIRKLVEGNYDSELTIRKGDKLHVLVEDLNELTKRLRQESSAQGKK
jgi:signal transduction histidine kinase